MKHLLRMTAPAVLVLTLLAPPDAAWAQGSNLAARPMARDGAWWGKFHLRLTRTARANPRARLVFAGDSITEHWRYEGKAIWKERYAPRGALNLGISGDQTHHLLWRLKNGAVRGLSPRVVVLLIGVNNLYMPAAHIAAGVRANVRSLRKKLPRARILLLGVFPCGKRPGARRRKIQQINRLVARAADGKAVHYLDIGHRFLEKDGTISERVMHDHLHLTARGYQIWADAMGPTLKTLLR